MSEAPLSIGKLAKATGFTVERLRMWELRYKAPKSQRLKSGHRRYSTDEVERLRLVRESLARGLRPHRVVALSREALLQLLASPQGEGRALSEGRKAEAPAPWRLADWIAAVERMDDAFFDHQFYQHWLALGSLPFLTERARPFAEALGQARQNGSLGVAEENYGAEKLSDFLSSLWRRLNEDNSAGPVLLSTLPGDAQRLGLQMAALVAASAGLRVICLGPAMPPQELTALAQRQPIQGILLSVSAGLDAAESLKALKRLRESLPAPLLLATTGAGAPEGLGGIEHFQDLSLCYRWALGWRQQIHASQPKGGGAKLGQL
jgi:hypothetical protein